MLQLQRTATRVRASHPTAKLSSTASSTGDSAARRLIVDHGGRVTRTRVAVIEALQGSAHPLSHDELGHALAARAVPHDRVTLYRALDWLVEQGIARRIAGSDRAWRFEIRARGAHHHAHFHCDRCGQVVCLEDLQPSLAAALPAGFQLDRAELVLHGACAACGRSAEDDTPPAP
ncbi:Fur family transcriptional regulator [Azoarcus olearius]|uniref:Regulatory protein n=1 Tax=Azoarcus sp. (strain BH72) TaxID=418699 RepID=A1K356_AZOSB|nr:putative regulatory protein [Azoarcus olearius]